ncbi:MAG: hypothetical protein SVS15_08165 [Thermodesulfobacteriota bacterium]|nr:hypothetical protein [Thermodesulfobacteriota bacterium]
MPTLLITSMGGTGSRSLLETIRQFDHAGEYTVIGTHCFPLELVKADLEYGYLVPKAVETDEYMRAHLEIIKRHAVDLFIANSDKEVAVVSPHRQSLPCAHLIPDNELVAAVQDKYQLHAVLKKHGCAVVENVPVESRGNLAKAAARLEPGRFWVRSRGGSGSMGATWVDNASQAAKWIDLWCELRGLEYDDFVLAPFLPGRDFCVAVMFQDGEFCIGKAYERLSYIVGDITLSGMGSSPANARTVGEKLPVDTAIQAVRAVYAEYGATPHGYYQLDLKCDQNGAPYVTEINIGRFPMTNPHFDRVGEHVLLKHYVSLALEPENRLPRGVYDLVSGGYILRSIDFPIVFTSEAEVAGLTKWDD